MPDPTITLTAGHRGLGAYDHLEWTATAVDPAGAVMRYARGPDPLTAITDLAGDLTRLLIRERASAGDKIARLEESVDYYASKPYVPAGQLRDLIRDSADDGMSNPNADAIVAAILTRWPHGHLPSLPDTTDPGGSDETSSP